MSRLGIELQVRALRARLGAQLRRGQQPIGTLRCAVTELEAHTPSVDQPYLQERLVTVLHDCRINLLVCANPWLILPRGFYVAPAPKVGPMLLDHVIVTDDGRVARITEVVTSSRRPAASMLAALPVPAGDLPGRLCLYEDHGVSKAAVLCGKPHDLSAVTITAVEPLEGAALMRTECGLPGASPCTLHGGAVVRALGLGHRDQGADLARRESTACIASMLRPFRPAAGTPLPGEASAAHPDWRWRVAHRSAAVPSSPP